MVAPKPLVHGQKEPVNNQEEPYCCTTVNHPEWPESNGEILFKAHQSSCRLLLPPTRSTSFNTSFKISEPVLTNITVYRDMTGLLKTQVPVQAR